MQVLTKLTLFTLVALAVGMSGCGKKYQTTSGLPPSSGTPTNNGEIPTTPTTDTVETAWSSGGSAVFNPASSEAFNRWVGDHPVEPENPMINVEVQKVANKTTYAGTVKIRYKHNGTTYEAVLKSGTSTYKGKDFYRYNYWFPYQGKQVFSGFFEDKMGAIVLVIDQLLDLGDGGGKTQVAGEVWFKNFGSTWAGYDEGGSWSVVLPCWFREIGPYDCRSNTVINKTGLYPDGGYEKLGDFSNMNKRKAFIN